MTPRLDGRALPSLRPHARTLREDGSPAAAGRRRRRRRRRQSAAAAAAANPCVCGEDNALGARWVESPVYNEHWFGSTRNGIDADYAPTGQ